jgi:ArsR family transcriptional regulator
MKGMDSFRDWAEFYKALGDPTRLHLLAVIARGPHCVCELVLALGVSQPTVSHHLRRLREAGIVEEERSGQWVYYRLVPERVPFWRELVQALPDVHDEVEALAADTTLACHVGRDTGRHVAPAVTESPDGILLR